ncbi:gephyrin-like molybdotransferase receptor GlpR [Mycolicibacterium hippocampi]|uniref:Putative conserved transmembrane protein n=1 Tax=Mycolicibacterium hippocampi TaxID=659824 RepID=A0A850PP83_9MYCO|nr:gephyrin-like molybdotransferase receptor GlpR [Mycolicibacterium hippocampi]NVN52181.1 putative conserved transmembrane protein [Mycolicibacterium hippocampi]
MPSIPQSLLWISLVVLWLFVLVPMLINKRDAVRRTSDVALATRVLNSSATARLRRRRGPATGHRSDPDWRPSHDDIDESDDLENEAPSRSVVMVAAEVRDADADSDYLDVDVVEDSGALPISTLTAEDERVAPVAAAESDELTLDYGDSRQRESARVGSEDLETVESSHEDDEAYEDDAAYEDQESDDGYGDGYEYVDDSSGLEAPSDTDLRIADSMSASRRRRRESSTAEAVTARKYRFRARTLTVMAVLLLSSAVAAFTWSSTMWWVCGVVGAITLLYLAYLRRQTRIEERVRRRRAQRVARSRLGVENTADQEFDVVPARLRRPGAAVLEIDDEDPEFEHLEYVPFARHYDLPRAAGQ